VERTHHLPGGGGDVRAGAALPHSISSSVASLSEQLPHRRRPCICVQYKMPHLEKKPVYSSIDGGLCTYYYVKT
jgi:hypothetical protein